MSEIDRIVESLIDELHLPAGRPPSAWQGMFASLFAGVPGGQNQTGVGGLNGLMDKFRQAGIGYVADSWTGPAPDLAVTPYQLQHVLGSECVQHLANKVGVTPEQLLAQLSEFLPIIVARLAARQSTAAPAR